MPCRHAIYKSVNVRAVRLHDVVGQTIGVVTVVMMYAKRGQQAGRHERAGYNSAQYGIAIVKKIVGRHAVAAAGET